MNTVKLPPQATELEQTVLGAMLIENNAVYQVSGILTPGDFYSEKHQLIYASIQEMFQKGSQIDILTVTQDLRKKGVLESVGGAMYVTELTSRVNSAANIETHARIVAEHSIKRTLLSICSQVERKCYNETEDAFDCKNFMETLLNKLDSGVESSRIKSVREILNPVLKNIAAAMHIKGGITGVPSGFPSIDEITGGWQGGDLIIIAARPGMGKTAFVVCNALNSAIRHDRSGAIFSLEMGSEQLVMRMITSELDHLELSTDKLRRGDITDQQHSAIHKDINDLVNSKIFIDDTPSLSISKLRSKAYYLKRKHNIKWIIVDYLQLMTADVAKGGNREQEIAAISRGLKALGKDLNIPVIALSQLSRAVELRGDKRPQLSDLRESGAIEQDADIIAFLFRPEYYGITEDSTGNDLKGVGEFIIAKHRNGSLEDIPLKFQSRKTKFYDPRGSEFEPSSARDFSGYRDPSASNEHSF